jgi:hypothetical protein
MTLEMNRYIFEFVDSCPSILDLCDFVYLSVSSRSISYNVSLAIKDFRREQLGVTKVLCDFRTVNGNKNIPRCLRRTLEQCMHNEQRRGLFLPFVLERGVIIKGVGVEGGNHSSQRIARGAFWDLTCPEGVSVSSKEKRGRALLGDVRFMVPSMALDYT